MGSRSGFLTLNTSEFHSAAVASSLSDILETGDVPHRYFLSATACRGILRRAEKRAKTLPEHLKAALEAAAGLTAQTMLPLDTCRSAQLSALEETALAEIGHLERM
jgi:hypothetical protein